MGRFAVKQSHKQSSEGQIKATSQVSQSMQGVLESKPLNTPWVIKSIHYIHICTYIYIYLETYIAATDGAKTI